MERAPGQPLSRVTVVEQLYHNLWDEEPFESSHGFERHLKSFEESYPRNLRVAEEWIPIPLGHIEKPGMIYLINRGLPKRAMNPTDEEKASDFQRVLMVKHAEGDPNHALLIPLNETLRITAQSWDWVICCKHDVTRCGVTVLPE